jgi:hypothetical protein
MGMIDPGSVSRFTYPPAIGIGAHPYLVDKGMLVFCDEQTVPSRMCAVVGIGGDAIGFGSKPTGV